MLYYRGMYKSNMRRSQQYTESRNPSYTLQSQVCLIDYNVMYKYLYHRQALNSPSVI